MGSKKSAHHLWSFLGFLDAQIEDDSDLVSKLFPTIHQVDRVEVGVGAK